MLKKLSLLVAALVIVGALPASADTQIAYDIGGGPMVCIASPTDLAVCPAIVGPPVALQITVNSNAPGSPTQSNESGATVSITNTSASTQTINLYFAANDFTSPTAPPTLTLLSHIGGTVLTGSSFNLLSYTSCVDTTNALAVVTCGAGTIQSPTGSPSITAAGSFQSDTTTFVSSLGSPYALGENISFTLGAGSEVNFSSSTTLSNVPEPASMALFGSGLFGLAGLIRRRK